MTLTRRKYAEVIKGSKLMKKKETKNDKYKEYRDAEFAEGIAVKDFVD